MISRSRSIFLAQLLLLLMILAVTSEKATAQESKKYQDISQLRNKEYSLLRSKIEWAVTDMVRLVEEIRRLDSLWQKRPLVENVEEILFKEVEIPLYMYGEDFSRRVKKEDLPKMTEFYARAFALAGMARVFEGFSSSSEVYFERAKQIFPDILNQSIKIDSFESPRSVQEWIDEGKKHENTVQTVRVTLHAKNSFSQVIFDNLKPENVELQGGSKGQEYIQYVAVYDLLMGLSRKVSTDELFADGEERQFFIFLPPGKYELVVKLPNGVKNKFQVFPDPANNHLIIESKQDGLSIYYSPNLVETKEEAKTTSGIPSSSATAGHEKGAIDAGSSKTATVGSAGSGKK